MKTLVAVCFSLWLNTFVFAQTQFTLFDKVWGEPSCGASYTDELPNGDFVSFGSFRTQLTANQIYMCRTDSAGEILWERDFGFPFDHDAIGKVIKTSWGTYLLIGHSEGDTLPGFREYAVWNIDADGNVIFERYFSSGYENFPSDVVETSDSCFAITGVMDAPSLNNWALSILKIDRFGNQIWRNRIDSLSNYVPIDIEELSDGSYIVIGRTYVSDISFIAKYYPNGQLNWIKYPYGNTPNSSGYPVKIFPHPDTAFSVFFSVNYISTSGSLVWTILNNYDAEGNYISSREYSERIGFSFCYRPSNSVILVTIYDTIYQLNTDTTFTQVAQLNPSEDGLCKNMLYVTPTLDGGYFGVGTADCGIYFRYYMVKFGPDGRYTAEEFNATVTAYPNPSYGGTITLSFDMLSDEEVEINIYSIEGRIVYCNSINAPANTHTELPINTEVESITSGTYIVEASTSDTIYRNKIIILSDH